MRVLLALAAALALASCATDSSDQTAADARDCFFANQVSGYDVVDERTVQVRAGSRRYLLTTLFNARDLDWTQAIAIRSTTSSICTGNGLGVEIIGGDPQRTYPVQAVARAPDPTPGS